ncbi:hypothetical protein FOA52_003308 [Chlamydomonas sp. UWO 241]|nr:hypothetical protein FOA52_003308 [Chlamydomonas sp. UWO 241]
MRAAIALVLAALLCATLVAAEDAPMPGSRAAAFCKSSEPKSCGWAGEEEWNQLEPVWLQAEQGNCWLCGPFAYGFGPDMSLPTVIDMASADHWHTQWGGYAGQVVSLGRRPGKVVRTVFKALSATDDCWKNGYRLDSGRGGRYMMREPTAVQRCELQLPPHEPANATEVADETEIAAALRSTEVNCKPCTRLCDDCPEAVEGRWCSDTFFTTFGGCDAVAMQEGERYEPMTPTIYMNENAKFLLAKFEVQEAD